VCLARRSRRQAKRPSSEFYHLGIRFQATAPAATADSHAKLTIGEALERDMTMGKIDISNATRPTRGRVGGTDKDRADRFRARMPPAAKRSIFIRNTILQPIRTPPVNPQRTEIADVAATTAEIKTLVRDMGADDVGVAEYDHRFAFTQAGEPTHKYVVVFGIAMSYDNMADIGPALAGRADGLPAEQPGHLRRIVQARLQNARAGEGRKGHAHTD